MTITTGEVGGNNGWKRGKGCQGTCIKDTWTKPKGDRIESGTWRWLGWVWTGGGKMETTVLEKKKKN